MRLGDITKEMVREMSFSRAKAEVIVIGLEEQINLHLLRLMAVRDSGGDAGHWRVELRAWLTRIANIRLKPRGGPGTFAFYYEGLFGDPYGGNEDGLLASRVEDLRDAGYEVSGDLQTQEVLAAMDDFYRAYATGCAAGTLDRAGVAAMVAAFPSMRGGGAGAGDSAATPS